MKNIRISKETGLSCLSLVQAIISAEQREKSEPPESLVKAEVELADAMNRMLKIERAK